MVTTVITKVQPKINTILVKIELLFILLHIVIKTNITITKVIKYGTIETRIEHS